MNQKSLTAEDVKKYIRVRGARENNLKSIDINIPRDQFVVLTGLSGSGKSSLAFDTIYAEGQRRYMQSLSSYARMFLGQMEKPDVDSIEGLPPAISIEQKSTNRNPRSTVGTVTEIYDYFRLLYARVGTPHCPNCGREIARQSIDQMVDEIMALPERTRIQLLAPVVRGKKGEHQWCRRNPGRRNSGKIAAFPRQQHPQKQVLPLISWQLPWNRSDAFRCPALPPADQS